MENVAFKETMNPHDECPAQSFKRASFKKLNSQNISLTNLMYGHDTEFAIMIGRSEGYFELQPEQYGHFTGDKVFFTLNGYSGSICINEALVNLVLHDISTQLPFYDMPVEMQQATLNAAIARMLKSIGSLSQSVNVEVSSYTLANPSEMQGYAREDGVQSDDDQLRFAIRLSCMGKSIYTGVEFEPSAYNMLSRFLHQCDALERATNRLRHDVPIVAKLLAGWQTLPYSELAALAVNDVVILEGGTTDTVRLSLSNQINFEVTRKLSDSFTILSQCKGKMMDDYPDSGSLGQSSGAFENSVSSASDSGGEPFSFENSSDPFLSEQTSDHEPNDGDLMEDNVSGSEFAGREFESTREHQGGGERGAEGALSQETIPVNLVFEMGRKALSFEEVQHLDVGYTFDLAVDPNNAVTIMANGVKVGEAEIVEIAGRLGARVVNLEK